MRIVMLSDFETQFGAAISASRLAEALCRQHRVTRIVGWCDAAAHPWTTVRLWPSLFAWGMRHVMPDASWREFSARFLSRRLRSIIDDLQPDVINVHNLHGMSWTGWSINLVRECAASAPTVWTLHDMWSFTGRCAYSYDCGKFSTGCDTTCPTPSEYPDLQPARIQRTWRQRRDLLDSLAHLTAVAPSMWLERQAHSGLWANHRIEVIPYGLSLNTYFLVPRKQARMELGLHPTRPVVVVAAANLTERRKGVSMLVEALRRLRPRPITVITLGDGQLDCHIDGIDLHPMGYISDERAKAMVYNAADLLVHPAPVDNLPNTVMEALACGTPVVGFPIGGVPEMVRPGKTGWLAEDVSSDALARTLSEALDQVSSGVDLRGGCRAVAEADYSLERQAVRYTALFESLLSSKV